MQITIYNSPDLSRKVTVDAAGDVSLPLAGNVDVRGLETDQAAERIGRALDPYFKSRASVRVEVLAETGSIFVSGGPGGILKYEPGETLTAALSDLSGAGGKTGGFSTLTHTRADLSRVSIVRDGNSIGTFDALALSARGDSGPALQPGDTISLADKPNVVQVLGDVVSPGNTYLAPDEPLDDAIAQAGGVRDTAASANLVLARNGKSTPLALGATEFREPAQNGDVLTVPTAPRVSIVGTVNKPGIVSLKTNFTLLNALYEAGGPAKRADLSRVQVMHGQTPVNYNVSDLSHGDLSQNPVLADGDLVFVPEGRGGIDFSQIFQTLVPFIYLIPKF